MARPLKGARRTSIRVITRPGKKLFFLVLTLGVVLAFSLVALLIFHHPKPASRVSVSPASFLRLPPQYSEHKIIIPAGQTLAGLLASYGLNVPDVHRLLEQSRPVFDLNAVQAGRELRLYKNKDGQVAVLEYDISDTDFLRVRHQEGTFHAELQKYSVETRLALIGGTVEDILINAFSRAGESDLLALNFAEVFAWDVDFYIDPQPGDQFRLLFEKKYKGGQPAGYGRILAAEFRNQGRHYQAFRFSYPDTGKSDYFDAAGNSLRKEFLKSPLKFGRITSRFSSSRYHPIRKIYRAHYAVDYAAPVGTPVRATADGEVLAAGWSGNAGRRVRLRHPKGYETQYLHLSRLTDGIKPGARVESGQVIGYVGSSGESTGPHLDYRILHHGKYINPLGGRFEPAEPLREEYREAFAGEKAKFLLALESATLPLKMLGLI